MTGKYRLLRPTCAVHRNRSEKGFIFLPKDAIVEIDAFDETGRMAQARWSDCLLLVFSQDVQERGLKIGE